MKWIQFVKDYQSKNNLTFKEAMKQAGPSYRKLKEGKKEPIKKKVIKIKKDKKDISKLTKEEIDKKYKDIGQYQKNKGKILEKAQFILTDDMKKTDKMIKIFKEVKGEGRKGISSNLNAVRTSIRDKLEKNQQNCESVVNELRKKSEFIEMKKKKKDLPFGQKTIKGFLNEGHDLIKKKSNCMNKKQLEEIKKLGIVTKTYYNNLTDTIKEEEEEKKRFLKLYPQKK